MALEKTSLSSLKSFHGLLDRGGSFGLSIISFSVKPLEEAFVFVRDPGRDLFAIDLFEFCGIDVRSHDQWFAFTIEWWISVTDDAAQLLDLEL